MNRRGILIAGAWVVAAAVTAAIGTVALDVVGAGILGPQNQPLSQLDVARALAAASASAPSGPATRPESATTPPATSSTLAAPRGLSTPGGSIVAQCVGGQVTLLSWSPAQGFRTDDVARGPAPTASIKFKNGNTESRVTVTCVDGEPHAESVADDHHR
jgi:hypothetical protein